MNMKWGCSLLFLLGLASFACVLLFPSHPKNLILVGCLAWLSAYILVLATYHKRKTPLPTLMGWVEKDKRPILYELLYLFMLFAGLFVTVVFLVVSFMPK